MEEIWGKTFHSYSATPSGKYMGASELTKASEKMLCTICNALGSRLGRSRIVILILTSL